MSFHELEGLCIWAPVFSKHPFAVDLNVAENEGARNER